MLFPILMAIAVLYLVVGVFTTRRAVAIETYNRQNQGLNPVPKAHKHGCRALRYQTESYRSVYCNCGYYKDQSNINVPMTVLFWPLELLDNFIHSGTYTPPELKNDIKSLVDQAFIDRAERELGITPLKEIK